jgi:hypothetical protein
MRCATASCAAFTFFIAFSRSCTVAAVSGIIGTTAAPVATPVPPTTPSPPEAVPAAYGATVSGMPPTLSPWSAIAFCALSAPAKVTVAVRTPAGTPDRLSSLTSPQLLLRSERRLASSS